MLLGFVYVTIILFIFPGKSFLLYRGSCRKDGLFKVSGRAARLNSSIISLKTFQQLSLCAKACLDDITCRSFNFQQMTKSCELLSKTKEEAGSEKLISGSGWNHYQLVLSEVSPRCISTAGDEMCAATQACDEVCQDPVGYICRNLTNIALMKIAYQSTMCNDGYAARAVDGNSATHWHNGSCTHTCEHILGGWWRVDFGRTAVVYSVDITNRGDCCGHRLSNFNIRVGNSTQGSGDSNTMCVVNKGVPQGETSSFLCKPRLYGRYLYVQSNLVEALTICEVKVYGEFY